MDECSPTPSGSLAALTRMLVAVRRTVRNALLARPRAQRGMTLLELMFAVTILGILMGVGYAGYRQVMERMRVSRTIADIIELQLAIDKFELNRGTLPDSLADLGMGVKLDPWDAPYEYLNIELGVGKPRKDRNLHPINTDYDLYSMGPDGDSKIPLTANASRDDIVRANDGRFIGKAEDY